MELEEIILYAANVSARYAWAAKAGNCLSKKIENENVQIFQRRNLRSETKSEKILFWKEGEEERKFQIKIASDNPEMDDAVEMIIKALKIGSRLWDRVIQAPENYIRGYIPKEHIKVDNWENYFTSAWSYPDDKEENKIIAAKVDFVLKGVYGYSYCLIITKDDTKWMIKERSTFRGCYY